MTLYSKESIHSAHLRRLLTQSTTGSRTEVLSLLQHGPSQLVLHLRDRMRIMHPVLAHEILFPGKEEMEQSERASISLDFINDVNSYLDIDSDDVQDLLQSLFITRETTFTTEAKGNRFADIIENVTPEAARSILEKLTETCPTNPHFWNHLGRHFIYHKPEKFEAAEECLNKAIDLSPDDHLHHHMLGMVRRFMIRAIEKELRNDDPKTVLAEVQGLFEAAVASFERVRELAPDDSHGYITQVQMTVELAKSLKRRIHGRSIEDLIGRSEELRRWISRYLTQAEWLLEQSRLLYKRVDDKKYTLKALTDLASLYGDMDSLIEAWEMRHFASSDSPVNNRALAYAYILKHERSFGRMCEAELKRITDLMESNMRTEEVREDDFRNWFEAYRYLPDFSMNETIHRLRSWADRFNSAQAFFYLYVVHFLEWWNGTITDSKLMKSYLNKCRALAVGRRSTSVEWLGFLPERCPIVPSEDTGAPTFDSASQTFRPPNYVILQRVNGTVSEEPIRAQSGKLIIDAGIEAFFVPGTIQWRPNEEVNFLLGFSYDGLRAWDVQKGWESDDSLDLLAQRGEDSADSAYDFRREIADQRAKELAKSRLDDILRDLLERNRINESPMSLEQIEDRVSAVFGSDRLSVLLGYDSFEDLVNSLSTADDSSSLRQSSTPGGESVRATADESAGYLPGTISRLGAKDFGFIRDSQNVEYHFWLTDVEGLSSEELYQGMNVRFIPTNRDGKPHARKVIVDAERTTGQVTTIGAKGFGYITDEDGLERHFFLEDVKNSDRDKIPLYANVQFSPTGRKRRPAAIEIEIIKDDDSEGEFPF